MECTKARVVRITKTTLIKAILLKKIEEKFLRSAKKYLEKELIVKSPRKQMKQLRISQVIFYYVYLF